VAEPLKNSYGPEIPREIARMIRSTYPKFPADTFVRDVLKGYEPLALTQRGWKIARALRRHLPQDYPRALEILMASLKPSATYLARSSSLSSFLYLPHTLFVAEYGLDNFEISMRAQHELTQHFTAEFSIRAFLEKHPKPALTRLKIWTRDPNVHVRRLVSEGTRPRLPWAPRLRGFQADPRPVLELLELLKDDPELYVRRSVANNLNDIGKDHPDVLVKTVRRWMKGATEERRWIVRHALRSAVKRAEAGALDVLGFGGAAKVSVTKIDIAPKQAAIGKSVVVSFDIRNATTKTQRVLADLRVHFVKSNGRSSPKVFKLKTLELAPKEAVRLRKTIGLHEMTTRKHYPGRHKIDVVLNGQPSPLAFFELTGHRSHGRQA
jgi:3-methyladenine DNA glycosylase AlkC